MNYWLLLEKSDETRISKGIDGYRDATGEFYHYDSLVPNHRNVAKGDSVVLRKESEIIGIGSIGDIADNGDTKIHRRCPECNSTDIRERVTKEPQWKCGKCAHEFHIPKETIVDVLSYTATIKNFIRLNSTPSVYAVKMCAESGNGPSSQLSMLRLDPIKIRTLFEGLDISPSSRSSLSVTSGQGFGLSQEERRAVELRAMHVARALYEDAGWKVIDKSSSQPFDLLATRGTETRYIEVKGTTAEGLSVVLTHGEVNHVRINTASSALVIVSGIVLEKKDGQSSALGGIVTTHQDPWMIDEKDLIPTQYRYKIK